MANANLADPGITNTTSSVSPNNPIRPPQTMPPNSLIRNVPLGHLATLPTLFPAPIAQLITVMATSARISLRMSAWLIECILESLQTTTHASLGYTRRLLITAISSARRMYLMSNAALDGDLLGMMGFGDDKITSDGVSTDGFLSVLDKYTNLGIYVIHSTFTMAELFAMSGFYLTINALQSAHFAAQESVALFDSLFGSNESSRSLASIITLIRREVLSDERFELAGKGKIASLTALTKALTAFSVLQSATWKRTSQRLHMEVICDCTVLMEKDERFKSEKTSTGTSAPSPPAIELYAQSVGGPPPSNTVRQRQDQTPLEEVNGRLQAHMDVNSNNHSNRTSIDPDQLDMQALWELEGLVGESGDEEYDGPPDEVSRRERIIKRMRDDLFEITDEMSESTVVTQLLERITSGVQSSAMTHSRQRSAPLPTLGVTDMDDEPEVSVDTTDNTPSVGSPISIEEENEWIEVDRLLQEGTLPSLPNGQSIGSRAYQDALDHPAANTERIQMVLKSMTQRLLTRKRTVRRVRTEQVTEDLDENRDRPDVRRIEWEETGSWRPEKSVSASPSTSPSISGSRESTPRAKHRLFHRPPNPPSAFASSPSRSPTRRSSIGQTMRSAFKPITSRVSRSSSRATSPDGSGYVSPTITPEAVAPGSIPPPPSPQASKSMRTALPQVSDRPPVSATHRSVHTSDQRLQTASAQALPEKGNSSPESLFPHDSLIRNAHRFMRYSSAAYGQSFLRILGLGNSDFNFPTTGRHHANSWAFAQHTNIPIDSLILSSYTESSSTLIQQKAPPLVHYIAVEHSLKAIVLTCRGTLGLSDVLVDLTCDYRTISVEGGDPNGEYYVHSGMYYSALQLTAKRSTVHQTLVEALKKYPTYGLVLCGHSLGGGVAALLSIICSVPAANFLQANAKKAKPFDHPAITTPFVTSISSGLPPGRPIHAYAYGIPAVASIDLAKYTSGLITSVIQNSDVVPCLSLGVLRDLKNVAVTLAEEGNVAEEIVGRVVGIYQRKSKTRTTGQNGVLAITLTEESEISEEEELNDWMMSLIKTMRADMDNEKLYPPGMVYIMEHFDVFISGEETQSYTNRNISHQQAHRVILRQCDSVEERFREPLFTKTMLNDHLPSKYERSTQLLYEGLGQGKL